MEEQHISAQGVPSREASVASGDGNPVMGAELPEENRASPAVIPANEGSRVPRRGRHWPTGAGNARRKFQLSVKAIVGTRAASRPYNSRLQ
jgi:hypothetical protein